LTFQGSDHAEKRLNLTEATGHGYDQGSRNGRGWLGCLAASAADDGWRRGRGRRGRLGAANAPVTIIEYASMTCPHCSHFHETTFPEMKKKYIDTGKVRFIFREFPLDPLAAAGSMLARCAGGDKYFPLLEALFSQQKDWVVQKPLAPMLAIAKQAGFTQQTFDECLANQKMLDGIEESRTRAAQKFGVNSTPTFFINGKIFRGALTPEELDKQMAPYLKS
jgi:protein-disulfide isomerase